MVRRVVGWMVVVVGLGLFAPSAAASDVPAVRAVDSPAVAFAPPAVTGDGELRSAAQSVPSSGLVSLLLSHGLLDAGPVDVYVDDELWLAGIQPADSFAAYFYPQAVVIDLKPAGTTTSLPGFPVTLALDAHAGTYVAAIASYPEGASQGGITVVELATGGKPAVLAAEGRLQSIHAANTGSLRVKVNTGWQPTPAISYGGSSTARYLMDDYQVGFTPGPAGLAGSPIVTTEIAVLPGCLSVAIIVSDASGTSFSILKYAINLGSGYTLVTSRGEVFPFGNAWYEGDLGGTALNAPIVAGAPTWGQGGYWLVAADGGVFTFGDAEFFGSTGGMALNSPVISVIPTPTGAGYWLLAADGGVFTFGDAEFFGSTGAMALNAPVISGTATASGRGYWLVAADGGIFTFGDAEFFGSTGDLVLNRPVIGIAAAPADLGYFLVAADGGVFTFGSAQFHGSAVGLVHGTVAAVATTPSKYGYWVVTDEGEVRGFGDAGEYQDLAGRAFNGEVIAIFG